MNDLKTPLLERASAPPSVSPAAAEWGGPFLPARKVWERYGVTSMTLHRWLADPRLEFPAPIYLGRFRYWRLTDLLRFEADRPRRKADDRHGEAAEWHSQRRCPAPTTERARSAVVAADPSCRRLYHAQALRLVLKGFDDRREWPGKVRGLAMRADLVAASPIIGKLIPLLASDHDGEVISAARAIGRMLAS